MAGVTLTYNTYGQAEEIKEAVGHRDERVTTVVSGNVPIDARPAY